MNCRRALLTSLLTLSTTLLEGCGVPVNLDTQSPAIDWEDPSLNRVSQGSKLRLGVALSGGSMRGYAHIGAIRAFAASNVRPDIITGTSIGALIGSLWAAGFDADFIESIAPELTSGAVSDWILNPATWWRGEVLGLANGKALDVFLRAHLGERQFSDLPVRFATVAADLQSGETVPINKGLVRLGVRASSALPVALQPVKAVYRGGVRSFLDGGLVEPIPVWTARRMGADIVIAVDVGYKPAEATLRSILDVSFQVVHIAINRLRHEQRAAADVVVEPSLHERDINSEMAQSLIQEGMRATLAVMPRIQELLAGSGQSR